MGCALVVASSDDRVRVWRLSLESADEQATRKAGRGLAFLQWVDGAATLLPVFAGEPGLYLSAATPETGKFRHHPLAGRRLAFNPKARALTLEDVPGQRVGPPRPPELVVRWDGRAFALQGRAWGAIERAQGF